MGITPVLDQMDFTPDPRFVAAFGLMTACAKVYGPRAYMIRTRLAAEKREREANLKQANPAWGGVAGAA
jgi:hypothetical protein